MISSSLQAQSPEQQQENRDLLEHRGHVIIGDPHHTERDGPNQERTPLQPIVDGVGVGTMVADFEHRGLHVLLAGLARTAAGDPESVKVPLLFH